MQQPWQYSVHAAVRDLVYGLYEPGHSCCCIPLQPRHKARRFCGLHGVFLRLQAAKLAEKEAKKAKAAAKAAAAAEKAAAAAAAGNEKKANKKAEAEAKKVRAAAG
jgi:hypothetical protein